MFCIYLYFALQCHNNKMIQFLHIDSYSLNAPKKGKRGGHSVKSIVDEAVRAIGSTPHIQSPVKPIHVFGTPLEELEEACVKWAESLEQVTGRKTRKDALCLVAGVISAPASIDEEAWHRLRDDSVAWLNKKYGGRLKTVIEHTDESHPHIHFYVVPNAAEKFECIHDGKRAAGTRKSEKKGAQNKAYIEAMRCYLDEYNREVGVKNCLLRYGPRRRRLTRSAWLIEQAQARNISMEQKKAQDLYMQRKAELAAGRASIERARSESIANGVTLGMREFCGKGLISKVIKIISQLPRENAELRSQLSSLTDAMSRSKKRAKRYWEAGLRLKETIKALSLENADLKKKNSALKGAEDKLYQLEEELSYASELLSDFRAKALNAEAVLEMYHRMHEYKAIPKSVSEYKAQGLRLDDLPTPH